MYVYIYLEVKISVPPRTVNEKCETSGPCRGAGEACDRMNCYTGCVGTRLPTFKTPYRSFFKGQVFQEECGFLYCFTHETGPIDGPET